jgi:hypothetical protein
MATIELPPDFAAFLRLLNEMEVEYLVVGGYAVGHHGYVRATGDLDIWVNRTHENAARLAAAFVAFGFDLPEVSPELFMKPDRVVRMGETPVRIEVQTSISGVDFSECWDEREVAGWDDVEVNVIGLKHLKLNKMAAGRPKDRADLDYLP